MGKALDVDWDLLQLKYQKDGLSCREIAEMFMLSVKAVEQHCWRHKWRKEKNEVVEKVSTLVVEKLVDKRLKLIEDIESEAIPIARKLSKGVSDSFDSMNGEPIDSAHLNGLANALKIANHVARLNAGAVDPSVKLDVTSGGLSMHESSLALLASVRKLHATGQLADVVIDIEGLSRELKESDEGTK